MFLPFVTVSGEMNVVNVIGTSWKPLAISVSRITGIFGIFHKHCRTATATALYSYPST